MSIRSKCYVGRYSVVELFLSISVNLIRVKYRSLYYINFMGNSGLVLRFSSTKLSLEEVAVYATSIIQASLAIAVSFSFEILSTRSPCVTRSQSHRCPFLRMA